MAWLAGRKTSSFSSAGVTSTAVAKVVVTGTAQQVADSLSRYIAAGARRLVVRLGALDLGSQRDQLEQVAALIPALLNQARGPETAVAL